MIICRAAAQSNSKWKTLPQHLMDEFISKLEDEGCEESVANMRLVSKAWNAAVRNYPGKLKDVQIREHCDIEDLCKAMPNMTGLEISSAEEHLDFGPLASLNGLTNLVIEAGEKELHLDLSDLPSSIRKLQLKAAYVSQHCHKALKCVSPQSSTLAFGEDSNSEIWKLLGQVPKLQVGSQSPIHPEVI